MIQYESNFGIQFRHFVMANAKTLRTSTFETKQTQTDSIPFSCVEDHQHDFAMAVKWGEKGVLVRVESGTVGASDYIYLKNEPAYYVIKFASGFVIIDVETFMEEKKRSKRKSLVFERAKLIAYKVVEL